MKGKIKHGLFYKYQNGEFENQSITFEKNGSGVFPLFYKYLTGKNIQKEFSANIQKIMGYCTDISHEYIEGEFGSVKTIRAEYKIVGDDQYAWPIISIEKNTELWEHKKSLLKFNNLFMEIAPLGRFLQIFEIKTIGEAKQYKFFEYKNKSITKENYPFIGDNVFKSIAHLYTFLPYDENQFSLCVPLDKKLMRPFNDILATYSTMYFLGSLVRYYPYYIEEFYESDSAWILERFTKSCPETFLRQMVNIILDEDYILTTR